VAGLSVCAVKHAICFINHRSFQMVTFFSRQLKLKFILFVALAICFAATFSRADANVTVSSFSATGSTGKVRLAWATGTELNNSGFNILKSSSANGPFTVLSSSQPMVKSTCQVGCVGGATYSFEDTTATPGVTLYYKLQTIDTSGKKEEFGPKSAAATASASATPTRTNTPVATATATNTPLPTSTSLPTSTTLPGMPTSTPMPTYTPVPTNTPAPNAPASAPNSPPVRVAGANPSVTPVRKPGDAPSAATNNPVISPAPTRVAAAPKPSVVFEDEDDEDVVETPTNSTPEWMPIFGLGIFLVAGVVGFAGMLVLGVALFGFLSSMRRR
jgi:hypothetical protein